MKGPELLAGAAKAATYNVFLQLSIRMMTFILNAVVLRYISKDMLGVVNVRLTLLYSTALFISTEAFDQACLSKKEGKNWTQVVNLMWWSWPVSIMCCGLLSFVWLFALALPDEDVVPHYGWGVISFAVATIITVLARPHFIIGQTHLFVKLRVLSVGLSELTKCLTIVFLVINFPNLGLISFSIGQIVHGITYAVLYYLTFYWYLGDKSKPKDFVFQRTRDFFPQKPKDKEWLDKDMVSLTGSFFKQSLLKQFLTEGEKYVMTLFNVFSFGDQGFYGVIDNTGQFFKELDDSYQYFFYLIIDRRWTVNKQCQASVDLAARVLYSLLRVVMLLGMLILVFGYAYSFLALDWYGGEVLSAGTGPTLLRWYCLYVLILAVNGITECFYFAVMSQTQIDQYNRRMVLFSLAFLGASLLLTNQFESVGFILANCINMCTRIAHSVYFIHNYYKGSAYRPLLGLVPSRSLLVSLVVSVVITVTSETMFCCDAGFLYQLLHVGIGGVCFLSVIGTIVLTEADLISFIREHLLHDTSPKQLKGE
ncbi:protein RFT1 homolog isoform X2 [Pecten maximus]|uniref:protein RFT1 homolog isoform X2 n=1 Tax=Pecten maximus TaxID=6579 RepID=UPI001458BC1D|nr:protein RFT1 homolog isoform X2 [Pecten maximus]